jgi:hypothetical protein
MKTGWTLAGVVLLLASGAVLAQRVSLGEGSVVQKVAKLRPGQYVWAPELAPNGPMLLVVNLASQRAVLFRNGVPIAASTVSTGRPGYRTPTGVFTILQKRVEHYSTTYDNAPMPFMQRLTWKGVALHAGQLPGYPASHGCIRLPRDFAKLLYKVTSVGMTVIITDRQATPRVAPAPELLATTPAGPPAATAIGFNWHPERSPSGPVSILVSAADGTALVLRNGIVIGSAPVRIDGAVGGTWAYALRSIDAQGQHWMRIQLSPTDDADQIVPREEWQRFHAPDQFKRAVAGIVAPGTTVVVTSDSLRAGAVAQPVTVIEDEKE